MCMHLIIDQKSFVRFNRGSQVFTIPLPLSKEILPSAIFYATVTPVLAYFVLDRFVIQPYIRLEQERYCQCVY